MNVFYAIDLVFYLLFVISISILCFRVITRKHRDSIDDDYCMGDESNVQHINSERG